MASRRKASTPCMIRPDRTLVQMDDDTEEAPAMETSPEYPVQATAALEADSELKPPTPPSEPPDSAGEPPAAVPNQSEAPEPPGTPTPTPTTTPRPQQPQQGGYECKYCSFSTQNLGAFKEHVDASHPNVILNPLYLCAVCNFNTKKFDSLTEHNERRHPGEVNFKFKRVKLNNQTVLEQTIEGCNNNNSNMAATGTAHTVRTNGEEQGSPGKAAVAVSSSAGRFAKPKTLSSSDVKRTHEFHLGNLGSLTSDLKKLPTLTAINVNGTVPKIAVPLNTSKYNPSLDGNLTLMSSFNKFPYPTQAELSWLTAASKHPEEQIKVWFTTQRLKQGISWSPEETFTVFSQSKPSSATHNNTITTSSSSSSISSVKANSQLGASLLQSLPCHLLGQTSLVLTPIANGSNVTCTPLALTLTNQVVQSLKRPLSSPTVATGIKRPSIIQTIQAPLAPAKAVQAPPKLLSFTVDPNKTARQLSLLRLSYTQCPFPEEDEIYRLIETTGLSRGEIKKWFSEQRLLNIKERVKGKSPEQLTALEESFQRSSRPTQEDLDQLSRDTKLSQTEVDCWFSERRALRDNMEKALLNLGGGPPRVGTPTEKGEEPGGPQVNGATSGPEPQPPVLCVSSSSSSSSSPPMLVASSPPVLSVAASPPVFCRTQWPSPEEYSQLEAQTGLGRTDIVRWFKDHRAVLKTGQTLDWMDGSLQPQNAAPEQNGRSSEKHSSSSSRPPSSRRLGS
ncbi:hypothetical protein CRUP_037351 [Coryphaenoides rupestris]|nr:hypothetical protein CRUP_037351 [Coryphaenoides rupestris]